ncbi:MAG: hypothetical protein SO072_02575 [Dysosmobacter sp.]|nr:hypothetical protein [Dysosmobacter sp.]
MDFKTKSKVYIQTDEHGRILRCEGQYTLPSDLDGWTIIEEGPPCDRLNLAQSHYFDGGLYTMDGIPRYKWDGSAAVLRTDAELEADRAAAVDMGAVKDACVAASKTALADYLADHPLTWTDGKRYSVTEEKQSLLMGNLAAYQLEVQGNPAAEITWNATGEPCTVWEYADLCALAVAIKAYVKPLVAYQQAKEMEIMACETAEDVGAVTLDYGSAADA